MPLKGRGVDRGLPPIGRVRDRAIQAGRRLVLDHGPWWEWRNRRGLAAFADTATPLGEVGEVVLQQLRADGVASVDAERLLGPGAIDELARTVDELEVCRTDDIRSSRSQASQPGFMTPYRISLLDDSTQGRTAAEALRSLATRPEVQAIADHYTGLRTQVSRTSVWRTFGTDLPPRRAQMFHQDYPIDRFMVKLFVYLSDVDEDCGPLVVLPGTHPRGTVRIRPPVRYIDQLGRSRDEEVAEWLPDPQWRRCTGPRGTLVLADFRGWHRGGWGHHDRLHAQALYTSRAGLTVAERD